MNSLYSKFAITTLGIMAFSFVVAFLISNGYYQHVLKDENNAKNVEVSESIKSYIESDSNINVDAYLQSVADAGYQIIVVDETHHLTYFGNDFREYNLSREAYDLVLGGEFYHGIMNFPSETFVTGFFANESVNTIGIPVRDYAVFLRPDVSILFNELQLLFAVLLSLMVILSVVLVLVGTKILINPISQLQLATRKLTSGNYDTSNINTERKDEIGKLSRNFVTMTEKIEQQQSMQKAFIANISHDIQSPLANIKGYSQLLETEENPDERLVYLNVINQEVTRMSELTEQLLVLTKLDYEKNVTKQDNVYLKDQIETLIASCSWQIEDKGLMISYELEDCLVAGDAPLLNMVWDNLLSNAIKYNVDGGCIDITLDCMDGLARFSIKDNGVGIKKEHHHEIFNRFYRVDHARSQSVKGSGLGLSIVKQIVELHGGSIELVSNETGTMFKVVLSALR